MANLKNLGISLGSMIAVIAVALFIISIPNIKVTAANSTNSNVLANVVVNTYCELAVSNSAVTFVGEPPGGNTIISPNEITVNSVGNANGNIMISGNTFVYLSNTIPVSNVVWAPTSAGVATSGANALTQYPASNVDTTITLPITAGSVTSNYIYFGVEYVPAGTFAGLYTANTVFWNKCGASGNSLTVTNVIFTVNVLGACFISLSNGLINFGSINPGANTPYTSNVVTDNAYGSNINSNILIEGTNSVSGGNNFYVSNTVWASANVAYTSGTALQLFPGNLYNTGISMPTSNVANNIYFGIAVPPGEPSGTYTSNIVLENLC